ncbi:MAG: efflux RND transporter periplasmic adaptor subunit [Verrucomicrobiae bacterium]|nr:efflux RND transporter periplasmic adaptor subunit [Verrucomicrobiae bacterium]
MFRLFLISTLSFCISLFVGCSKGNQGPGSFPPVPVEIYRVKKEKVVEKLPAVGSLEAEEAVEITPQTSGIIEAIHFEEGQTVKQGDLLVKLESQKEEAELANAEASLELAKINYERAQKLYQEKNFSQKELDESSTLYRAQTAVVERLKDHLRDRFLYAPFDGRVAARNYSVGQYVEPNSVITSLLADEKVKITFQIPENEASRLQVGQKVEIKISAYPNEIFRGTVYLVDSQLDLSTRTLKIKALADNPNQKLKAGMFANVAVIVGERDQAITIPEEAILVRDDNFSVFVVKDGIAKMRAVKLGIRLPGKVEVQKGLQEGEEIIVNGLQKVNEGSPVAPSEFPSDKSPVS